MDYGIANKSGQLNQHEIDRIVSFSTKNDILYFDTAQSYGNSEIVLGNAIKKLNDKSNLKVISKVVPNINYNLKKVISSIDESLKKLKINSLYALLAHRINDLTHPSFSKAINYLKEEQKIYKSGVSVYTPEEAQIALNNSQVQILQIPLNIFDRRWLDNKIIEQAKQKNIQLFFRSIFLQGLIFLNEVDLETRKMNWAKPYINQFNELLKTSSLSYIELTFNLLSNFSSDSVIIVGIDNYDQIKENYNYLKNSKINKNLSEKWWSELPLFPEKLLNPNLWKNN
ncbi:MAG: hypothetical protein CMD65_03445 [Gammaproteobacteria bacterium]|nr:hypothetical protein [Gammaproteobacteria bacterium]